MNSWDIPGALVMISLGAGAFVGFFAFVGVCALIERTRRGR